ncbi:MAG TPA: hypothetical protein VMC09_02050 [Anaerolineales bacterium]|nr:hypothetical protein [Anaerolineales bacterium]
MTRLLLYVCAGLGLGFGLLAYFTAGLVQPGVVLLVLGGVWVLGLARRWEWAASLGLAILFGAAALGFYLGATPVLLVFSALLALPAWDLAGFIARLERADPAADTTGLERAHLARLGLVSLAGAGLTGLALLARVRLPFEGVVGLVFLGIWGIGRVVRWLLQRSE